MGRLAVLSGAAVCAILSAHGFEQVRQRGSHRVMQRWTETGTTTVPVPDHATLKVGTLLSIIRQSGLPRALFES
ncbi:MAG: type II toxin-antitoxin system HicA family toxin [Deltaproteobacteria bacterium]|nr:type II toxin-antitoxin system HicA family toxin [Deltaproteobacteria bacterium]